MAKRPLYDVHSLAVALNKLPARASADQIAKTLLGAGVKLDEMKWLGLDDLIAKGGVIEKTAVIDTIKHNDPIIKETTYSQKKGRILSPEQKKLIDETLAANNAAYDEHQRALEAQQRNQDPEKISDLVQAQHAAYQRRLETRRAYEKALETPEQARVNEALAMLDRKKAAEKWHQNEVEGKRAAWITASFYHDPHRDPARLARELTKVLNLSPSEYSRSKYADWNYGGRGGVEVTHGHHKKYGPQTHLAPGARVEDGHLVVEDSSRREVLRHPVAPLLESLPKVTFDQLRALQEAHVAAAGHRNAATAERESAEKELRSAQSALQKAEGKDTTQYTKYTLPGGANHREMLLTLPKHSPKDKKCEKCGGSGQEYDTHGTLRGTCLTCGGKGFEPVDKTFKSAHWNPDNVLAHVRMNDRVGPNGEKLLHLEELQSDWHQAKRDGKNVPDAPFHKTWHELLLRRMLRYAADNGYDGITTTTGQQQADRYGLDKHLKYLKWTPLRQSDGFNLSFQTHDGRTHETDGIAKDKLHEYVGHTIASRILQKHESGTHPNGGYLADDELKQPHVGMRSFYDSTVPQYLDKLGKKFGSRVGQTKISGDHTVHHLPITEQMRGEIKKTPVVKFAKTVGAFDSDLDPKPARRDPWRNHSPSLNGTRLRLHLEQIYRLANRLNPRDYKGVLNNIKGTVQRILSGRRIIRNDDDAFTQLGRHLIASQPEHPELKPFVDKYNWHTMHDKISLDEMIHAHLSKIIDNHLGLTPDRLLIAAGGDKNRDKLIPHLKKALKGQAVIDKPITDAHIRDSLLRLRDGAQDRVLRGVHLRPDEIPVKRTAKALKFARLHPLPIISSKPTPDHPDEPYRIYGARGAGQYMGAYTNHPHYHSLRKLVPGNYGHGVPPEYRDKLDEKGEATLPNGARFRAGLDRLGRTVVSHFFPAPER